MQDPKDAQAVLHVFVDDYVFPNSGNRLGRYKISLAKATDSFEGLTLGGEIPPESVNVSIQVGIQALKEGGTGVAYWDNAEFGVTDKSSVRNCEANGEECAYEPAVTEEESGIDSMQIQADGQTQVVLKGPFFTNDQLKFENNAIYLERMGYPLTRLVGFGPVNKGQKIDVLISSKFQPAIGITPRD